MSEAQREKSAATLPEWHRKRVVYNLETLLPLLVRADELSREQARTVQSQARAQGIAVQDPAGLDLLLGLGLRRQKSVPPGEPRRITEEVVLRLVGRQHGLTFKRIDYLDLDLEVSTRTISESFARTNLVVPLRIHNGTIELLAFNPFRQELWEDLGRVTTLPYTVFLGTRAEINRLIDDFFQFHVAIRAAEVEFDAGLDLGDMESRVKVADRLDPSSQKHIIKAVDYMLHSALRERASDIHLEPKRDHGMVRYRIDGVMHTLHKLPLSVHQAMLSRLKSLSRMDIAERRRPQDGRIQLRVDDQPTDVRMSTIPVAFGEKMVLRLLSSGSTMKGLEELGMNENQLGVYTSFLGMGHGLILVTGPTGSGKSTTLYSTLSTLATPEVNVVTVEDPIEMVVEDFNQIGVQTKIGVTFGQMLRHILRQDPDIIMIGEMRDLETAQQAVQASLTGHLVFSTLHTNDAASSLTRLLDLGLAPYLINAALVGVVAQRLVRTICPHCKTPKKVDPGQLASWGVADLVHAFTSKPQLWTGSGCERCRRTGFIGRVGIFEVLNMDNDLKQAVAEGRGLAEVRKLVRGKGVESLLKDGVRKALEGVTTLEEVIRVAGTGN